MDCRAADKSLQSRATRENFGQFSSCYELAGMLPVAYEKNGVRAGQGKVTLSEHSVVVVAKDQVSCDLDGEAAILHIKKGVYYGLDPVGAWVWKFVQQPQCVGNIRDAMLQAYDVDPEQAQRDVFSLLENLLAEGLIEVRDASAA
jgi:hypothetical protein